MTSVRRVKLSDFAVSQGLTYLGAYKLWNSGAIEGLQLPTGTILVSGWKNEVTEKLPALVTNANKAVVYARVSSTQNKDNLASQAARLEKYSQACGYQVVKVVKETGSGLNDQRPELLKLLEEDTDIWDVLVVEHKDRLTRFGFTYLEVLVKHKGQRIDIVNPSSKDTDSDDLMEDFVSTLTSFCARLYGRRRSRRHAEAIVALAASKAKPNKTGSTVTTKDAPQTELATEVVGDVF